MAAFRGGDSRIEVDLNDVRTALARVAPEVEKELRSVVKKQVTSARNEVRAFAPVATGKLEGAISGRTQFTKTRTQAFVTVKGIPATYAWIVEHGVKGSFEGRKYIARAGDRTKPRFTQAVNDAVGDALKQTGLK